MKLCFSRKAFTLLELIVVIVIIGILATLGFTQYTKTVERGRTAEAKGILSTIRTLEIAYYMNYGTYTADSNAIGLSGVPQGGCDSRHYFGYWASYLNCGAIVPYGTACGATACAFAQRCNSNEYPSGGKSPDASSLYVIGICFDSGQWFGTPGYF